MAGDQDAGGWGPGTNSGHGYVWPRPDGLKARCGGPAICAKCARWKDELAAGSVAKPGVSCTCDAIGDGPCPVHWLEMRLQDLSIGVGNLKHVVAAAREQEIEVVLNTQAFRLLTEGTLGRVYLVVPGPLGPTKVCVQFTDELRKQLLFKLRKD